MAKRTQLDIKLKELLWLLDRKSKLSLENKILIYKAILKPVWTYGIQLWGVAAKSNINIIQQFQSKVLRMVPHAPWYVRKEQIHSDLNINTVLEEIRESSTSYLLRLQSHLNPLARALLKTETNTSRLRRFQPIDLITRML